MAITIGTKVRHKHHRELGIGEVGLLQQVAGVTNYYVKWFAKPALFEGHTEGELEVIRDLADQMKPGGVGPASFTPFTLRVLGRWFAARHALTGELSNQPFQMLPHQVCVTSRVVTSDLSKCNWLIADDVGLGKTIEAGMIMEVLRRRKLGRFRCLFITPAGLKKQWIEEMQLRFGRRVKEFDSRYPNDLEEALLVASIDTLKTKKFEDTLRKVTPWDLVIVDEAHHLATKTDVLKYKVVKLLRDNQRVGNFLFLTATPHSGQSKYFWNMLRLLREDLFPTEDTVALGDGRLNQVMIRNRKSEVTDTHGKKIFIGIEPAQIFPCVPTPEEVAFYEKLLAYVRVGYGVADRLKTENSANANAVGFLMSTFRKLASSSRAAIAKALKNRLHYLESEEAPLVPKQEETVDERFEGEREERDAIMGGITSEAPKKGRKRAPSPIENEIAQVQALLRSLEELRGGDSKLVFFLDQVKKLTDNRSDLKLLIFTEYRTTQKVLVEGLAEIFGEEAITWIDGSMNLLERRERVQLFNEEPISPRILVSTEAGGEGLNMQKRCYVVINYDLPWNPIRLQQRVGRVYRYGQKEKVQVYNVMLQSSSEAFADTRIEEYLRKKIAEITKRLAEVQEGNPEDIEGEVLGQVALNVSINDVYERAVTHGEQVAYAEIDKQTRQIEEILKDPRTLDLFKGLKRFDITDYRHAEAKVTSEHLEYFVRKYLGAQNQSIRPTVDGLFGFTIPKDLEAVAAKLPGEDPDEARETLKDARVERATVDKEKAQKSLNCRLLRFGDIVFDSMVRHVQDSDFSEGVATLSVPAAVLGWQPDQQGVCAVFDLKVLHQEGSSGARVLREELVAYSVPRGGAASLAEPFLEALHHTRTGPIEVDPVEARRGHTAARGAADAHLAAMLKEVVTERGTGLAIVPQLDDFALAWVEAHG